MALECARLSRDILGANGVADDYPIMRHLMNLESVKTYEGTHDIHTLIIGASVTGLTRFKLSRNDSLWDAAHPSSRPSYSSVSSSYARRICGITILPPTTRATLMASSCSARVTPKRYD